jgi:uncharacterized protein
MSFSLGLARRKAMRRAPAHALALLFACLAIVAVALPAPAAELPKLTGRVVDDAGMLDPASKAALTQKLADFEKKSSDQIVVATIDQLDGEAIEPYANRLYRAWGLGHAGENNGVLLLVAKNDRKMRIEVGYGLEGTLTDLHSKLIIENTMVPAFRAGDFSGGITRAVDDIIMVLEGNAAELEARAGRNPPTQQNTFDLDPETIIIMLWLFLFFGGFALAVLPQIFGTKIGPGRYRWLGMDWGGGSGGSGGSGWSSGGGWSGGSGWSSGSSGGFSGGGGSSGGGGASGSW